MINNKLRPQKTLNKTGIKLYSTLSLPALLQGSENWTITEGNARRITAAETKYRRQIAGPTWTDYKTDTQIAKELNITAVLDKIQGYRRKWLQHTNRTPNIRLPRVLKNYRSTGRRDKGRSLKRLLDVVRPKRVNKWPNSMLARR
jgi:hypothetical protein